MTYVTYQITNKKTKRYYIGYTSLARWNANYMGSGIHITGAVKKHGRGAFYRAILAEFPTRAKARQDEAQRVDTDDPLSYNLIAGGLGGPTNKGRHFDESWRHNLSKHSAGRKWYYNPQTAEQKFLKPDDIVRDGFIVGRAPQSQETREAKRQGTIKVWNERRAGLRITPVMNLTRGEMNPKALAEASARMKGNKLGCNPTSEARYKIGGAMRGKKWSADRIAKRLETRRINKQQRKWVVVQRLMWV